MRKLIATIVLTFIIAGCAKDNDWDWDSPVIPVSLKGIEAVNIDNSGKFPAVTNSPVKKEAYMIGIKWITYNPPADENDKFITGPILSGQYKSGSVSSNYSKAIKCNTPFNSDIPAGKYVSNFFKEINRNYLPAGIDEGFVLLVAPYPGEHSFRVEYYEGSELKLYYDTPLINLF